MITPHSKTNCSVCAVFASNADRPAESDSFKYCVNLREMRYVNTVGVKVPISFGLCFLIGGLIAC